MKKKKQKNNSPVFVTLALAEAERRDPEINTTHPSVENVIETREWSRENQK